jgi:hypothetical protein
MSTPWVAQTEVADTTVGEVAGRALQFAFEGTGAIDTWRITPQTSDAAQLLSGTRGPAIEQALRGIASTIRGHEGNTSFRGITLARSDVEYQVNSALNYIEGTRIAPSYGFTTDDTPTSRAALQRAISDGQGVADGTAAQAPNWVNLGSFATRELVRLAGRADSPADARIGTWLASMGAHEPQHTISPLSFEDVIKPEYQNMAPEEMAADPVLAKDPFAALEPLNWVEEGTADTLANWPGRIERVARNMGVPFSPTPQAPGVLPAPIAAARTAAHGRGATFSADERALVDTWVKGEFNTAPQTDGDRFQLLAMHSNGAHNYPSHVAGMHLMLAMAGIDPKRPDDYAKADQLLQGGDITGTPGRIADAIIQHRRLDPELREQLQAKIRDAGADIMSDPARMRAALADVVGLVKGAASAASA